MNKGNCPDRTMFFFTQNQGTMSIPFGVGIETTVLTLPAATTRQIQSVKLDYTIQLLVQIQALQTNFSYGVRTRLRRNSTLLVTQTFQQGASKLLNLALTRREYIPNTWVDDGAAGQNTYTITLEYFQRSNANLTVTAETRSLNAIVID
ncbi:hypothetical protein [Shouchella shacheensis]|uniref:hypothetical protein n=1 Tax=Shouchella shacheensis TaxID=1649580 RepID=UPI0012FA5DF0|nr:hypothetical protein [Shouchella shacheensis]